MKLLDLDKNQRKLALELFHESLDAYDKLVTHKELELQAKTAVSVLLIATMVGPFYRENGDKFFEALKQQMELLHKKDEVEDVSVH